jgi:chromosome segregation ATPase
MESHYTAMKQKLPLWIPIALVVLVLGLAGVAYTQYDAKSSLEQRVADLETKLQDNIQKLQTANTAMAFDLDVVTKKVGVTDKELTSARAYAEKLHKDHEEALKKQEQMASALAGKADSAEVAANLNAARAETASKIGEVQKESDTKIGTVSGEVKTVASNLETTRADLAASRRDLVDVKTTLSDQIARNASELQTLRQKGEKDFFEFTLKKGKKNEMTRVGDIRLELRDADTKKQRYGIVIQVDDSKLEKKDKLINEPVQFLVGSDQLRYEIVVNKVEKDAIKGYLSTPKNKALAAERPVLR